MAVDSTRQVCGNCGALNDADAVVCVVCSALLAAYVSPPEPESIELVVTETETATPAPEVPTVEAPIEKAPSPSSGDWRSMFESKPLLKSSIPQPSRDLEVDFRADLPQSASREPEPPIDPRIRRERATRSEPEPAQEPQRSQQRTRREPRPTIQTPRAAPQQPSKARQTVFGRPGVDPRFNRRRPQSMIGFGVFLLLLGCVVAVILSAAGAGDTPVALAFLCLSPLGFIAIIGGIVIAISRKEGRGG